MITQELLWELFHYENGLLYWRIDSGRARIGNLAGAVIDFKGFKRRYIGVHKKYYYNSRLIFMYHYGFFPKKIDNINGDPLDDRIENLRDTTPTQKGMLNNNKTLKFKKSVYKGVSIDRKRFRARIKIGEKTIALGYFSTEQEAAIAYNEAAKIHYGEFANLNTININN